MNCAFGTRFHLTSARNYGDALKKRGYAAHGSMRMAAVPLMRTDESWCGNERCCEPGDCGVPAHCVHERRAWANDAPFPDAADAGRARPFARPHGSAGHGSARGCRGQSAWALAAGKRTGQAIADWLAH